MSSEYAIWEQIEQHDGYARPPNAGWYTGCEFQPGAPWGPVKTYPDASFLTHVALRSANPPPGATEQYFGCNRFGNSSCVYFFDNQKK